MIRLKELREDFEIEQKALAIDLHVSQPTISDWESGKKTPSIENVIRLAEYFRVSIDYLMYRSDTRSPGYSKSFCWANNRLCDLRTRRGESQKYVADSLGISAENYMLYENAQIDPPIDILDKLADHFCVDVDFILRRVWESFDSSGQSVSVGSVSDFHIKSKEEQYLVERFRLLKNLSVTDVANILALLDTQDQAAAYNTLSKYLKLDTRDQGNVDGRISDLLESDKYSLKKESKLA